MDDSRSLDPPLLILTSLAGGDKHGYAIMEDVEALSGVRMGPGTLYGALTRLEERGWIAPLPVPAEQSRRRPYRLTERGRAVLQAELNRLSGLAAVGLRRLTEAKAV
jgi:DNA-binding PadR family transcriptional regulator